jgi:hypothetical protein
MRMTVSDLDVGDVVDLHLDRYADPAGSDPAYGFEYAEVTCVEAEVDGWVRVHFEGFSPVSFPADHPLQANAADDVPDAPGPR